MLESRTRVTHVLGKNTLWFVRSSCCIISIGKVEYSFFRSIQFHAAIFEGTSFSSNNILGVIFFLIRTLCVYLGYVNSISKIQVMHSLHYTIAINNEAGEVDPPRARGLTFGFLGIFFLSFVCFCLWRAALLYSISFASLRIYSTPAFMLNWIVWEVYRHRKKPQKMTLLKCWHREKLRIPCKIM